MANFEKLLLSVLAILELQCLNVEAEREAVDEDGEEDMKTRKQSWLLRLFQSKLFNPALAINYLFIAKEPGVLEYIGNRLFRNHNILLESQLYKIIYFFPWLLMDRALQVFPVLERGFFWSE